MKLVPWNARKKWLDLFEDLDNFHRLFDINLRHPLNISDSLTMPAVDILDEKDQIKVKADLPGMKKEDIEINVESDVLTLKGEKKNEKETREKDYACSERYYGSFRRAFSLPAGIDAAKTSASYKEGVLEITLPKKEGAKPKQIKVDIK